jgi:hypothetical protein
MPLDPAPWRASPCADRSCWHVADAAGRLLFAVPDRELAEKIALWRNAEDVAQRRGWTVNQIGRRWFVRTCGITLNSLDGYTRGAADPATALVEADAWMREREANDDAV